MANLRHRCRRQQAASRTNPGLGVYCSSYEQSGDDLRPRHWRRRAKRLVNQPIPGPEFALDVTWSRWFGQLEGLVKVYSDCEITPSSSSAPALTGGCHGWHEAGSYPVIDDDDDALWNCGNLAAGAQAWAAALAREIPQRPVGARLAFLRIQRDGERASTGRAGPQCRVGHGARSAHALTASSFSMNWNGVGAGQRPAHQQPDETPSTPMKRDRAGAG